MQCVATHVLQQAASCQQMSNTADELTCQCGLVHMLFIHWFADGAQGLLKRHICVACCLQTLTLNLVPC